MEKKISGKHGNRLYLAAIEKLAVSELASAVPR